MEASVDVLVPQAMEEIIDAMKYIPQEQSQNRTVEQIVGVLGPQTQEEFVEVPLLRFIDQGVDIPVTMQRQILTIQGAQQTVEVLKGPFTDKLVNILQLDEKDPAGAREG